MKENHTQVAKISLVKRKDPIIYYQNLGLPFIETKTPIIYEINGVSVSKQTYDIISSVIENIKTLDE